MSLLLVALSIGVFFAITKDTKKSSVMVGLCCIAIILYNPIFTWIQDVQIETPFFIIGPNKIIFSFFLLALAFSFIKLIHSKSSLTNLTAIMNVVAITLVLMPIVNILSYRLLPNQILSSPHESQGEVIFDQSLVGSSSLPDIYHIVLDAYARWDIYRDYYNFGNDRFRKYLEEKGFLVSDVSRANYAQTALTFASMLNMEYLQERLEHLNSSVEIDDRTPLYQLTRENTVFATLRKAGYQIQVFESGYEGTDFRGIPVVNLGPSTDKSGNPQLVGEFQNELIDLTPFPAVFGLFGYGDLRGSSVKRARMNFALDNVGKIWPPDDENDNASTPVYNLVHIMAPHHPHLYKADGTPFDATERQSGDACRIIGKGGISAETYIERHVDYVKFLNGKLKQAIDRILDSPRRNTVILLSSDHGPRSSCDANDLTKPVYVRERTANLLAVYAREMENQQLFSQATPVNYYRIIFNNYLDTNLPVLPDRIYYSSFDKPFAFIDVTESTTLTNE